MEILYIMVPIVLAIIAGSVASEKNRSGAGWAVLTFFFPIALLVLIFLGKIPGSIDGNDSSSLNSLSMKCPQCAETIKRDAKICRFCKYDVEGWMKTQKVKVDTGHENLNPSDMLATGYFYKNKNEHKKSLAYFKRLIEKYPNSEEAKAAFLAAQGKIIKCPMCAELIDADVDNCEFCGHTVA